MRTESNAVGIDVEKGGLLYYFGCRLASVRSSCWHNHQAAAGLCGLAIRLLALVTAESGPYCGKEVHVKVTCEQEHQP